MKTVVLGTSCKIHLLEDQMKHKPLCISNFFVMEQFAQLMGQCVTLQVKQSFN